MSTVVYVEVRILVWILVWYHNLEYIDVMFEQFIQLIWSSYLQFYVEVRLLM